jgi:biotin carboxyl carrier protein
VESGGRHRAADFQRRRTERRRRAAEAAYDAAAAQYRATVLTAFQNVADTLRALDADAAALKAQAEAEALARETLTLAEQQYKLGGISYLALLDAQRSYQQTHISLVQAQAALRRHGGAVPGALVAAGGIKTNNQNGRRELHDQAYAHHGWMRAADRRTGVREVFADQKLIASAPKPAAQVVTAVKVQAAEWQPQLNSVGTLAPVRGVDVTTEIAGLVREVRFKSGDEVKAGQVLFELNADSDVAQLRALQAADLSGTTLKRDKLQLAAQAISQAQVDADEADLKSKQALVAQQKALVDKKTIRAPFAGKLGITAVNPGQYLNPGDKLVTLQTIDTVYVDFFVPQKQLASLSIGQKLNLSSDAYPGVAFPAKVTSINPKVDAATRNVQVQATVPMPSASCCPACSPMSAWIRATEKIPDLAADGHYLQPVWLHRVRAGAAASQRQGCAQG